MRRHWLSTRLPASGDERGTSLVLALLFTTVIAVVIAAVIGLADANLRATRALRQQAAEAAAADGAAKIAINTLRTSVYNGTTGLCLGGGTLSLPGFYDTADGEALSTRVECAYDDGASIKPGATGAGFALLALPQGTQEGIFLKGNDNANRKSGMQTHGDVGNTGKTHLKNGELAVTGHFNSGSCQIETGTSITDRYDPATKTGHQILDFSPECHDPTGADPNYEPPAETLQLGDWDQKTGCNGKVRTFQPGVYMTSAALSALKEKCGVSYFSPGVYWFGFDGTWTTQNTVVAGSPNAPGLNPNVHDIAKACSPFEHYDPNTGVVFVFGGKANWTVDKDGRVALCARTSRVADQPAIALFGLTSSVSCATSVCGSGTFPGQSGCTLLDKDAPGNSACPTFRTTNANNVTVYLEGSTYMPKGWVDLDLHSSDQYIVGGLVVRQFSLNSPASSSLPEPLSSGPIPGGPGGARTVVYLSVYVCPSGGSCATGGSLRLKVKVAISDPEGAPDAGGNRPVTVLSWSVQR